MHIVAKTEKHVVQKWVAIICERPKHIEEKSMVISPYYFGTSK